MYHLINWRRSSLFLLGVLGVILLMVAVTAVSPAARQTRDRDITGLWVNYPSGGTMEYWSNGTYRMKFSNPTTGVLMTDEGTFHMVAGTIFAESNTGRPVRVYVFWIGPDVATFRFIPPGGSPIDLTYARMK